MSPRIVAIFGGGDWSDASVDHLVVPADVDLQKAYKERREWYHATYVPGLRGDPAHRVKYLDFTNWLIEHHGARYTTEDEVEEFNDT